MDKMNLFNRKGKSSKALFGDNKPKANTKLKKKTYSEDFKKKAVNLASKVGVTKAAEELGVSTSSIYSWQKTLAKSPAPIQDENGNITFELERKTYSLNVNSKEERERVKEEVNANSLTKYDWFKEETGEKHWAFYNTEMYEVEQIYTCDKYIHYKENSNLNPVIPVDATSCYYMFYGCYKLNQLDLSNFDTSNITDMCGMFKECKSLSQLDLSNFGTSQVTDMCGMFSGCIALAQLDLSNFDTSEVIDMYYMFSDCTKLVNLNLSSFNTSKVTSMEGMFRSCLKLTSFDLSNFDTSKVTTMSHMFTNCYNVKQLDLSNFDTSNVFDMSAMFFKCFSLTQLDLSGFNTSMVEYMKCMFYQCRTLTTIYISDKWKTNRILNTDDMFRECYSLPGFNQENTYIKMAKPVEEGGYLILKNWNNITNLTQGIPRDKL